MEEQIGKGFRFNVIQLPPDFTDEQVDLGKEKGFEDFIKSGTISPDRTAKFKGEHA